MPGLRSIALGALAPFLLTGCLFSGCGGADREFTFVQDLPEAVLHRAEGMASVPHPDDPRESALWSVHFRPDGMLLRYGARFNDTHVTLVRSEEPAYWANRSSMVPQEALAGAVLFIENVTTLSDDDAAEYARGWILGTETYGLTRLHAEVPFDEAFLRSLPASTTETRLSHGNDEEDRPMAGEWLGVWDVTLRTALDPLHPASADVTTPAGDARVVLYIDQGRVRSSVESQGMSLPEAKEAIRQAFAMWELPPPTFADLEEHEMCSW